MDNGAKTASGRKRCPSGRNAEVNGVERPRDVEGIGRGKPELSIKLVLSRKRTISRHTSSLLSESWSPTRWTRNFGVLF